MKICDAVALMAFIDAEQQKASEAFDAAHRDLEGLPVTRRNPVYMRMAESNGKMAALNIIRIQIAKTAEDLESPEKVDKVLP